MKRLIVEEVNSFRRLVRSQARAANQMRRQDRWMTPKKHILTKIDWLMCLLSAYLQSSDTLSRGDLEFTCTRACTGKWRDVELYWTWSWNGNCTKLESNHGGPQCWPWSRARVWFNKEALVGSSSILVLIIELGATLGLLEIYYRELDSFWYLLVPDECLCHGLTRFWYMTLRK